MKHKHLVIDHAKRARVWAEEYAFKNPNLFDSTLCGLCAIASVKLFELLSDDGYTPLIAASVEGWEMHVFILLSGELIDITASQYGQPPIVITDKARANKRYWRIDRTFQSVEDFLAWQRKERWIPSQIALTRAN
jgi:hypothetical protein